MKTNSLALAFVAAFGIGASTANADVLLSDTFNSYGQQLNWTPPAIWTVPSGSVDLIGETPTGTSFDFYPGNGGFVDLHGSTEQAGTLQTLQSFAAGNYTLSFDLGGNARGDVSKTTVISLGSFSRALTLASNDPLQPFSFSFATSGGNLSFADLPGGSGNVGNILDNVSLSSSLASAAPEPSTWAMMLMGFCGIGFMAYRKSKSGVAFTP
ncbi:MAG TPA: PEP-CTERM sorting domain-containing protein [Bradyrhizobium sp.]|nr:PEP-CTERM sorting domain-containing protein [Bradyrhizobium sp.]HKO70232.1 PEP-CTERM sorting domain-containing protein [Bradyrhizobium sp.]